MTRLEQKMMIGDLERCGAWSSAALAAFFSTAVGCGAAGAQGEEPGARDSDKAAAATGERKTEEAPAAGDFDKAAATTALSKARAAAKKECGDPAGPTGATRVRVVWASSGVITSVRVEDPPFRGTAVGECIASWFAKARVPPFEGAPVAVTMTVQMQ